MSALPGLLAGRQSLQEEGTEAPPSWAPVRPPLLWVSEWPRRWAWPADPSWHAAQARGVKPVRSGGALTDLSFLKARHCQCGPEWASSGQTVFRFGGRGRISMRQNTTRLRKWTAPFHHRETGYSFGPHPSSTNPVLQSHSNICSRSKL